MSIPGPGRRAKRDDVAWKLCATMQASDVTATLDLALTAAGLDQVQDAKRAATLVRDHVLGLAADVEQYWAPPDR